MNNLHKQTKSDLLEREFSHLAKLEHRCQKIVAKDDLKWALQRLKAFSNRVADLRKRVIKGNKVSIEYATNELLRSPVSKVVAVLSVIARGRYENVPAQGVPRSKVEELAGRLQLYWPLTGSAKYVNLRRSGGKSVSALCFSGNIRAAQFLVVNALIALGYRSSREYNQSGKGRDVAIRDIATQIISNVEHWRLFDLKSCFASINRNHAKILGLPSAVLWNVCFVNRYIPIKGVKAKDTKVVRSGLPFGAATSGIIAAALIDRKLRQSVGEDCWVATFADDAAVGGCCPAKLEVVASKIRESFESDPAGPLFFKRDEYAHADNGFEFLGYWVKRDLASKYYKVRMNPNITARRRLEQSILNMVLDPKFTNGDQLLHAVEQRCVKWRSAFGARNVTTDDLEYAMAIGVCVLYDMLDGSWGKKFSPVSPSLFLKA